jgi:hypothetical protein
VAQRGLVFDGEPDDLGVAARRRGAGAGPRLEPVFEGVGQRLASVSRHETWQRTQQSVVDRAVLVTPPARFALALSLAAACSPDAGGAASTGVDASSTAALATASASATGTSNTGAAPASASAAAATASGSSAPSAALARTDGCPEGMVRVEGDYCPDVEQTCKKHHPEYERDQERRRKAEEKGQKHKSTVSERCLEYAAPTVCKSKDKRRLSFCIDPFEYPNEKGQLPALLISWTDAKKTCEGLGKRLCTEDEFNFACEGPEMLPYTYGFVRDPAKCSIDKPYRKRSKKLFRYDKCMQRPACKQHLAELDQRLPHGLAARVRIAVRCLRHERQHQRVGGASGEEVPRPLGPQGRMVGPRARALPAHRRFPQGGRLRLRGGLSLLRGYEGLSRPRTRSSAGRGKEAAWGAR